MSKMTSKICKHCEYFNWKLSGSRNWGECLNPEVLSSTRLSLKLVDLERADLDEVRQYARIHFDEDNFGCILFEHAESDRGQNK